MDMNHVLIVEDDTEIREGVTIYLKSQGYEVFQASDGIEGLEILQKEEIHLAIIDIYGCEYHRVVFRVCAFLLGLYMYPSGLYYEEKIFPGTFSYHRLCRVGQKRRRKAKRRY